jgi:hypothetical protein
VPHMREVPAHNLPLICPRCTHGAVSLLVMSLYLLTVQCAKCTHSWSLQIEALPEVARSPLAAWCRGGPPG